MTAADCDREAILLNVPFQGGYITRWHGRNFHNGGLPCVQIEMNRSWYLSDPWYDPSTLTVDPQRLEDLKRRFHSALNRLGRPWAI